MLVTAGDAVEGIPGDVAGVTDTHDGVGDGELEDVSDGDGEPASNTHTHMQARSRGRVLWRGNAQLPCNSTQLNTIQGYSGCSLGYDRLCTWKQAHGSECMEASAWKQVHGSKCMGASDWKLVFRSQVNGMEASAHNQSKWHGSMRKKTKPECMESKCIFIGPLKRYWKQVHRSKVHGSKYM